MSTSTSTSETTHPRSAKPSGAVAMPGDASQHEHGWVIASRHATSEGWIAYAHCAGCSAWRLERLGGVPAEREAVSRILG